MPNPIQTQRYCILKPDKGPVQIKFSVSNEIMAGADFKIYDESKINTLDEWKMTVENNSYSLRTFKTNVKNLNKAILAFQILCCSLKNNIFQGTVELEIIQDNESCQMTLPAKWQRDNIPPCVLNNPDMFGGSITFILKS